MKALKVLALGLIALTVSKLDEATKHVESQEKELKKEYMKNK